MALAKFNNEETG